MVPIGCVDYRKVNTVVDPELMPQPEQIFTKLEQDRVFSTFDVSKGYWQVTMSRIPLLWLIEGYTNFG